MKSTVAKLFARPKQKKNSSALDVSLIQGMFSSSEAADILLSFLNDKIKFHTIKQLNLNAEDEEGLSYSKQRINDLQEAKKKVTDLLVSAHKAGALLEITSTINIKTRNKE